MRAGQRSRRSVPCWCRVCRDQEQIRHLMQCPMTKPGSAASARPTSIIVSAWNFMEVLDGAIEVLDCFGAVGGESQASFVVLHAPILQFIAAFGTERIAQRGAARRRSTAATRGGRSGTVQQPAHRPHVEGARSIRSVVVSTMIRRLVSRASTRPCRPHSARQSSNNARSSALVMAIRWNRRPLPISASQHGSRQHFRGNLPVLPFAVGDRALPCAVVDHHLAAEHRPGQGQAAILRPSQGV